jgi:LssY-like putative type I secretion system component LssY
MTFAWRWGQLGDGFFLRHRLQRLAWIAGIVTIVYLLLAYVILPALWTHYERQPGLASRPMVTRTKQGIPGDPLNVGLVGSKDDVIRAMSAAG